jgi:hypothetical protein
MQAINILETLLLENDEDTEVWFIAAQCYLAVKDYDASREYR